MKKILARFTIVFCIVLIIMGCSGCSINSGETQNGGQTEVETITTLEGVWVSDYDRGGEHEKIIIEGTSIKCYINQGVGFKDKLDWAGIYIPFMEPINEGEWTFEEDLQGYPIELGIPEKSTPKTFKYAYGKLSCEMRHWLHGYREIYFTKVEQ